VRGVSSTVVGTGLLALAVWDLMRTGGSATTMFLAAGALFFLYRGYQGLTVTEAAGDPMLPIQFVANPRGALIDLATDQVTGLFEQSGSQPAAAEEEEERKFDPDAIIARYLEKRGENPPPAEDAPPPPARTFGRKGL
jgi:hypothetical protein